MFYRLTNNAGFTLLELLIAGIVSSMTLAVAVTMFAPSANAYKAVMSSNESRLQVAATMDSLEKDASQMLAIYVDPNQCYLACMVDGTGYRVYYYWDPKATGAVKSIYRKREVVTNPIKCTGGKTFSTALDTTKSTFAMNKDELLVTLSAFSKSTKKNYAITSGIFPQVQERRVILTEGFECATLKQGWVVTNGNRSSWSLQGSAHLGNYQIADTEGAGGSDTTTIEIPIDLSRIANAHVAFSYMNDGTIASSDKFTAELYDGTTWKSVFADTNGLPLGSPRSVEADLSGYALNSSNKIRFSGILKNAGAHWYVDGISVFNP